MLFRSNFNPVGMSRLQLLSKKEDVVTDVLYTSQRPVANLYGISGLYGMVLAVPVAGVLKILFNKWVSRKTSIADNA